MRTCSKRVNALFHGLCYLWSPLKTSCERKWAVCAIFVVKPPRKAYSLTSSAFLESGTPCPFLLFTPVFRGSPIIVALFVRNNIFV